MGINKENNKSIWDKYLDKLHKWSVQGIGSQEYSMSKIEKAVDKATSGVTKDWNKVNKKMFNFDPTSIGLDKEFADDWKYSELLDNLHHIVEHPDLTEDQKYLSLVTLINKEYESSLTSRNK